MRPFGTSSLKTTLQLGGWKGLRARPSEITKLVARPNCEAPRQPTVLALLPRVAEENPGPRRSELRIAQIQFLSSISTFQESRQVLVRTSRTPLSRASCRGRRRSGVVLDRLARGLRPAGLKGAGNPQIENADGDASAMMSLHAVVELPPPARDQRDHQRAQHVSALFGLHERAQVGEERLAQVRRKFVGV